MFNTQYDWQYRSTPTERLNRAMVGETLQWPRGKVIGGSSAINGMKYFRGIDDDSLEWFNRGNSEWHPNIVREYYRKAESLQNQELLKDPYIKSFYGLSGPQAINNFNQTFKELTKNMLESYRSIGIKPQKDIQIANLLGTGVFKVTAFDGKRASTGTAYLNIAQERNNLKILKNAMVTKILINNNSNNCSEAYGVELDYDGRKIKVIASLEVILSAGSINSPQLLMLSGVGPKKHLESVNITCIIDLPAVGQNLQDHITIPMPVFTDEVVYETQEHKYLDVALYAYNRTGYLARHTVPNVIAFYSRDKSASKPEFELHLTAKPKNSPYVKNYFAVNKKPISDSMSKLSEQYDAYIFEFNLLKPYSRGNITLKSNNPYEHPFIYPNYFEDPRDLVATAEGLHMLKNITNSEYFKSINGFIAKYNWSECDSYVLNSVSYWKCISPDIVRTIYHPVGTCSMGPDPRSSVVDSRLRVHNVKGLRVIDGSIMPTITSCNTNGPIIMIAERGADLVKEDYENYECL